MITNILSLVGDIQTPMTKNTKRKVTNFKEKKNQSSQMLK